MRRPAAVLVFAALVVACRSPGPGSGSKGLAACDATKAGARAKLVEHRACTADWDCEPFATPMLGCDGVVAVGAEPPWVERALVDACTNLPVRALGCSGQVPACVEGQCAFRKRTDAGCGAARAAFVARLDAAVMSCDLDEDCGTRQVDDRVYAFARSYARDAAREARAFDDACGADQDQRDRLPGWARCLGGRCQAFWDHRREDWVKPYEADPGCFLRGLERRGIEVRPSGRRLVPIRIGFPVDPYGRIGPFEVSSPDPSFEEAAMASALSCRWRPAVIYGVERESSREVVVFVGP